MTSPAGGDLGGLSQADAIRRALTAVGDDVPADVAWLAEHGRPGIARNRVYHVLARDGRPIGKPRPPAPPGTPPARRHRGASAAAELGRLGHSWAAEAPPASWRDDLEGEHPNEVCGDCGGPLEWTGARTAVVCPACLNLGRSGAAIERAAAVAESWAPRRQAAGPSQAQRDALAREAHTERADLLRVIAEWLDDPRLSDRALDVLDWYAAEARNTGSLAPEAALARLADLDEQLAAEQLPRRHGWLPAVTLGQLAAADEAEIAAQAQADAEAQTWAAAEAQAEAWADDDQADDDQAEARAELHVEARADALADRLAEMLGQARDRRQITSGAAAWAAASWATGPATGGPYCEPCRAEGRHAADGTYRPAAARAEWPGMVPAPRDLCAAHLTAALAEHGRHVAVIGWHAAAPGPLRVAWETARRERNGSAPLSAAELLALSGARVTSAVPRAALNGRR